MKYQIDVRYRDGTMEFYYIFDADSDDFLNYLFKQKNLKKDVDAFSFGISRTMRTIRIIKSLATDEKKFNHFMKRYFEMKYNESKSYDGYEYLKNLFFGNNI